MWLLYCFYLPSLTLHGGVLTNPNYTRKGSWDMYFKLGSVDTLQINQMSKPFIS